eukprot:scaffold277154_cov31-Tisochrysis_lutea.AAC.1
MQQNIHAEHLHDGRQSDEVSGPQQASSATGVGWKMLDAQRKAGVPRSAASVEGSGGAQAEVGFWAR